MARNTLLKRLNLFETVVQTYDYYYCQNVLKIIPQAKINFIPWRKAATTAMPTTRKYIQKTFPTNKLGQQQHQQHIKCFSTNISLRQQQPQKTTNADQKDDEDEPPLAFKNPEIQNFCSNNPQFIGMETEFPCVSKTISAGPEPQYDRIISGFKVFSYKQPFHMKYGNRLIPEMHLAYETWGRLNEKKDNAVMIFTGLSASSHAKSHKENPQPGWWEKFIGPGCALDSSKYFIICINNLGGCYGSSGPSSTNPTTGKPYCTTFPLVTVEDIVHSQFLLLNEFGIETLHGSVGSSLGGMLSLMSAALYPNRVGRLVSISACAQSHPSSIAMRYLQRKIIMMDPNWNKGYYYDGPFPHVGLKLAREIATMTYRSGPEWNQRFGRTKIDPSEDPSLCPTFSIENYLAYQGESFSKKFDPNALLYLSKAMDLFDMQDGFNSLTEGLSRVVCPCMIIGVKTDVLFPVWQQRDLAEQLQIAGNQAITYYELNSLYGHDTFLLDLNGVGSAIKGFLETDMKESGWITKHKKISKT